MTAHVSFKINDCVVGQITFGGVLSIKLTVKVQLAERSSAFVTVIVTSVLALIIEPGAGTWVMINDVGSMQVVSIHTSEV
jgi:hypothetical protein